MVITITLNLTLTLTPTPKKYCDCQVQLSQLIFPVALKTIIIKYSKYNFKQYIKMYRPGIGFGATDMHIHYSWTSDLYDIREVCLHCWYSWQFTIQSNISTTFRNEKWFNSHSFQLFWVYLFELRISTIEIEKKIFVFFN